VRRLERLRVPSHLLVVELLLGQQDARALLVVVVRACLDPLQLLLQEHVLHPRRRRSPRPRLQ
jgi:hypothetical protein